MSLRAFRVHQLYAPSSHPGQRNASARKRRNQKLRREADGREASKRGVSIIDLYLERVQEHRTALREEEARRRAEQRRFEQTYSSRRSAWGW